MLKLFYSIFAITTFFIISSCGSGGGTTTITAQNSNSSVRAVLKPTALTTSQNVAGIQLKLSIPDGITPILNSDGSTNVSETIVITSAAPSNQLLPSIKYSRKDSITVTGIVASGFGVNDSITINLKVEKGYYPTESDFKLISFEAYDTNGATISVAPTLTTTIQ